MREIFILQPVRALIKYRINRLLILVAATSVLVACQTKPKKVRYLPVLGISTLNSSGDTVYHTIDTFRVVDQMGQIITNDTFRNKIYVANFFFVTCPGICRQMNNNLQSVEQAFAGNKKIKFLSFTVNPEQDTVPALLQYAKLHNAVPYQWYFLRGDRKRITELAIHSFLAESNGYLVHSQNLALIDSQGRIRGIYSGTVQSEVDKLIADIRLLQKEENENNKS